MEHKWGCVVCGKELVYLNEPRQLACLFCKRDFSTQAKCVDGHFICDTCHSLSANDLIERFTLTADRTTARYGHKADEKSTRENAWAGTSFSHTRRAAFGLLQCEGEPLKGKEDRESKTAGRTCAWRLLRLLWRLWRCGGNGHIREPDNGCHASVS